MYYVPQEANVECRGSYGNASFNGSERTKILNLDGREIATVCTRFYKFLLMEGTAILNDRGAGKVTVNYGGVIGGVKRYFPVSRCSYGEGVKKNLCLLPYHTVAADNKIHKVGDILYIPKAEGLVMPDGTLHDGFFIVRDTGSAFNGIGPQRVDLFTGIDPDFNNVFSRAGFNHKKPLPAFKVLGDSAERIKDRLKDRFGVLY